MISLLRDGHFRFSSTSAKHLSAEKVVLKDSKVTKWQSLSSSRVWIALLGILKILNKIKFKEYKNLRDPRSFWFKMVFLNEAVNNDVVNSFYMCVILISQLISGLINLKGFGFNSRIHLRIVFRRRWDKLRNVIYTEITLIG